MRVARKNTVPLIPFVRDLSDRNRARLTDSDSRVLPTSGVTFATGTPLDLHNVFCDRIDLMLNACEACGGLASNLYDLGVADLTIQRILRHANVQTTGKGYIELREHNVTAGMAPLEAEIRRTETVQ
jgi:hypothetical protein